VEVSLELCLDYFAAWLLASLGIIVIEQFRNVEAASLCGC